MSWTYSAMFFYENTFQLYIAILSDTAAKSACETKYLLYLYNLIVADPIEQASEVKCCS